MSDIKSVCVFAGSNKGSSPRFAEAAKELGKTLTDRDIDVVFGGGKVGLMGVLADEALARGGAVTGVIPETLMEREVAHAGLTELIVVDSMHTRKALMASRADAFIAIPGGMGTLEELFEVLTWKQLGLHAKPCGLLNVEGYYDNLLSLLDHAVDHGLGRVAMRNTYNTRPPKRKEAG